jgi:acetyltransferase
MRTPPREADLSGIDGKKALDAARTAARAKRALLTEPEAKAVLAAYGIPTVPTSVAASLQEVEEIAVAQLKRAPTIAIKVLSQDISHKSDEPTAVKAVRRGQTPSRVVAPCPFRKSHPG